MASKFNLAILALPFSFASFSEELNKKTVASFIEEAGGLFGKMSIPMLREGMPLVTLPETLIEGSKTEAGALALYRIARAATGQAGESEPKAFIDALPGLQGQMLQCVNAEGFNALLNNPFFKPAAKARAEKVTELNAFDAFTILCHREGWAAMIQHAGTFASRIIRDYSTMTLEVPSKDGKTFTVAEPDANFRRIVTEANNDGAAIISGLIGCFGSYQNQTPRQDYGISGLAALPVTCKVGDVEADVVWQVSDDGTPRKDLGVSLSWVFQPLRAPGKTQSESALKAAGKLIEVSKTEAAKTEAGKDLTEAGKEEPTVG